MGKGSRRKPALRGSKVKGTNRLLGMHCPGAALPGVRGAPRCEEANSFFIVVGNSRLSGLSWPKVEQSARAGGWLVAAGSASTELPNLSAGGALPAGEPLFDLLCPTCGIHLLDYMLRETGARGSHDEGRTALHAERERLVKAQWEASQRRDTLGEPDRDTPSPEGEK